MIPVRLVGGVAAGSVMYVEEGVSHFRAARPSRLSFRDPGKEPLPDQMETDSYRVHEFRVEDRGTVRFALPIGGDASLGILNTLWRGYQQSLHPGRDEE